MVKPTGKTSKTTTERSRDIEIGFVLSTPFANRVFPTLIIRKIKDKSPRIPVVAKISRTKLDDLTNVRPQRASFWLKVACLNLVKSVIYVPNPLPKRKL